MRILFYGELYPNVIHGVSMANRLNIDLLSERYEFDIVQEKTDIHSIGSTSFTKIKQTVNSIFKIAKYARKDKHLAFYTVLSLSLMGMLKTFLSILTFSIFSRSKIIVHLHRGDFKFFYHKRIMHRWLVDIVFKFIDRMIVLSVDQKTEMANYYTENAIFVVENSTLEEFRYPKKTKFDYHFIFVSNYIKEKGVFDLLEAFSQRNDLTLDCFGAYDNNEEALKTFQSDHIVIHRPINGKDKFDAIYQADALILPSWNEGQPTVLLEAMMVGTIVLSTKVGLVKEMLGTNYPFYFEPKNPQSMIECVNKFMKYKNKEQISRNLKERYLNHYSQEMHKKKIFDAFAV